MRPGPRGQRLEQLARRDLDGRDTVDGEHAEGRRRHEQHGEHWGEHQPSHTLGPVVIVVPVVFVEVGPRTLGPVAQRADHDGDPDHHQHHPGGHQQRAHPGAHVALEVTGQGQPQGDGPDQEQRGSLADLSGVTAATSRPGSPRAERGR